MKLQPYNSYQSLDIEWNQSAPSHWRSSRLKFDSYIKARVGWHGLKSDEFTEEGPYLITGSDFSGKVIDWSKCYRCEVERYEQDPYIQLKDDDLLITKDGTIGKVILTGKLPGEATLNSGVFVLRPLKERYDTKYYYWLMQSSVFHGFVEYYRTGSTIAHLYQETFCNLPYALPPIDEQTQIATFLDCETAKIDRLIEKQQQLIELLEEKRQAVISHAVTKGLMPDVPMRDSGVEWLGEVPAHWEVVPLKYLCSFSGGGTPSKENLEYWNGDIPWVSPKDMKTSEIYDSKDKITLLAVNESSTSLVKAGAVLIVVRSGILQHSIPVAINKISVALNQDMKALRFNQKLIAEFMINVIRGNQRSLLLAWGKQGATVESIEQEYLANTPVPVPPLSEQKAIIEEISGQCLRVDQLMNKAKQAINLMKERRSALISAAVTGKIDVRDQVPQDVEEAVAS